MDDNRMFCTTDARKKAAERETTPDSLPSVASYPVKNKGGRPKGSKNKPAKEMATA